MKLHGGPLSPFVRKVGICLIEKQLEGLCTLVRSPTAIVIPNVALMRVNPLSKIPTLITDSGTTLFDSDVICEYLDVQYPQPVLIPADPEERWQALRWNALGSGALDALVLWRFERNRPPQQQSPETLAAYATKLDAILAFVEADMPALASAPFGVGQIAIGALFGYLDFRFADVSWRSRCPLAAMWYSEFATRPAMRRTVPFEGTAPADHLWSLT